MTEHQIRILLAMLAQVHSKSWTKWLSSLSPVRFIGPRYHTRSLVRPSALHVCLSPRRPLPLSRLSILALTKAPWLHRQFRQPDIG